MVGRVEVYFNLHKRCFSIRQRGRVIDHRQLVVLSGCTFVVQPAGQRRVRETGVKNVHAFVRGTLEPSDDLEYSGLLHRVRYNPFVSDTFFILDGKKEVAVKVSDQVMLTITPHRTPVMWGINCGEQQQ